MSHGACPLHRSFRQVALRLGVPIVLCTLAVPVLATDHFNLESGIPTTIEDITPTERGSAEFHAFGSSFWSRSETTTGQATPRVAFGILRDTQLEVAAPFVLGEGVANGNGDAQVSVLHRFRDDSRERWRPGLALEADLTLPTGVETRGYTNRVDAGLSVLLRTRLGSQGVHVNAGVDWSDDRSEYEVLRRSRWNGAIGHHAPVTPWLVLVSDLAWRQADAKQEQDVWLLETGFRAQLMPALIGAMGLGAGLNQSAETPALSLSVGVQISL